MYRKIIPLVLLFVISFGAGMGYVKYQEFRKGNFKFDGHWIATSNFNHLDEPVSITSQAYIAGETALFHDYFSTIYLTEKYVTSTEASLFQISKYRLVIRHEQHKASQDDIPKPKNKIVISTFYPLDNNQFFLKYRTDNNEHVYYLYNKKV
ncbi:hypothetical protein [Thaumasiovibrio subtropicus]|uniref:hypothetical protein n=1 Tax=Thaumasiovibrio subtropicus TaxID=1891207 RepID=UPI000B35790D|nr:hypothetical protein [Thaumasiovibrio subtropicus]